jgi:hypothetical protein
LNKILNNYLNSIALDGNPEPDNDKCIENASNPNKTIWQIIKKKIGKLGKEGQEIWLQSDGRKVTHPRRSLTH